MPNIIKVDTNDKLRVLLTDVLPYELPLWFTNYNMYHRFKKNIDTYQTVSGLSFRKDSGVYIPLNYHISRGDSSSPRMISIMHPVVQLKVCDFYYEYDNLIKYYCTKSKYSLRHPYRKSTQFYGKAQKGSKISDGVEVMDEERIVSSSYFKYKKYSFLYRFFESYEYHGLEKRFHSMLQVDISKCFPSIYTHSIGWAIKNKRLAKAKAKGSFDGEFDALMQLTNYNETNGIIIGPEVSRIFAEIILQKIDLNLVDRMSNDGYTISKDYEFRRYVDDYFIFYRSENVKVAFIKSLELSLIEYKLYLNEAKTTIVSRPFSTNISLAKYALKHTVAECFASRYKNGEAKLDNIVKLNRPDSKANKTISEIKMALAQHKVKYISISNYLFSAITKRMLSYLTMLLGIDDKEEYHLNWLLVDLDVIFFVHAMDIRIRPTDRLARVINDVLSKTTNWPDNYKEIIYKKVFDHIRQVINTFNDHANDIMGLETLNLLIILTMLPQQYQLKEDKIKEYFNQLQNHSSTNDFYFRWITFMLYIKDENKYNGFRKKLEKQAEEYLTKHEDLFIDSEYFMFYFDYLACPYIAKSIRKNMIKEIKKITFDHNKRRVSFNPEKQDAHILSQDFIVSWRNPNYLKNCLEKKEYLFPYN